MKRMTQILSLGLLLTISSVALAGHGNDRNGHDGYYGNSGAQHYNARDDHRQYSNHGHHNRYYVQNRHHARRHSHYGRACYAWHPRSYVAPRMRYGYSGPGLVIVYQPRTGLYIDGRH